MRYLFIVFLFPSISMGGPHKDISDALLELKPGAEWNLRGNTYEKIEWLDTAQEKPTKTELTNKINEIKSRPSMPTIQEQLDALFEGGQALRDMKQRIEDARGQ